MKKFIMKFYVGIIFLFLYIPIFTLIGLSFNASRSRSVWGGFTFEWYISLFANSTILNAIRNTLVIALLSSVIATIIALLAVIGMTKMHYVPRKVITGFGDIPMLNADIVTGIILMLLLSTFFRLGFASILLAHITFNIPYCFLSIYPKYRSVNFNVYESALDLGAGPFYAFIKVVLPEIMPGIVSGMIMAITLSMDDFVVTYFTKGAGVDTLSTLIYGELKRGIKPEMYALSSVIFFAVLVILLIVNFLPDSDKISLEGME